MEENMTHTYTCRKCNGNYKNIQGLLACNWCEFGLEEHFCAKPNCLNEHCNSICDDSEYAPENFEGIAKILEEGKNYTEAEEDKYIYERDKRWGFVK